MPYSSCYKANQYSLKSMKKFFLIFLCLCFCTHKPLKPKELMVSEAWDCDNLANHLTEESKAEQALEAMAWLSKNTVAYSYIGLNYSAEIAWDASVGLMHGLVLCGPFLVVSSLSAGNMILSSYGNPQQGHNTPAVCLPAPSFSKSLFAPPLGRMARTQTQMFRCPNVERAGQLALVRASCYKQRNLAGDRDKALQVLDAAMGGESSFACFPASMQELLVINYNKILSEQTQD